jgi:hypothetical protein
MIAECYLTYAFAPRAETIVLTHTHAGILHSVRSICALAIALLARDGG